MNLNDLYRIAKRNITQPLTPEAIWECMTTAERKLAGSRESFLQVEALRLALTMAGPIFTMEATAQGLGISGKVICGFPGVGKSTLFKELKDSKFKVLDSDSSKFDKSKFPDNYIGYIKKKTKEGYTILASSHKEVRDALIKEKMLFTLVYPDKSLKDEYLERYKERGSPQSFIDLLDKNWNSWIGQCDSLESEYVTKVKLGKGEFVSIEKAGIKKPLDEVVKENVAKRSGSKKQDAMIETMNVKIEQGETKVYKKSGTFKARNGKAGEHIVTEIDGEKETEKTVKDGEVVIKGPKGEMYVVSSKKFNERYEVDKELTDEFQDYKAKGLIRAYEYEGATFMFTASWDEEMLCKSGDFLAGPIQSPDDESVDEVYRIERGVFDETYAEFIRDDDE